MRRSLTLFLLLALGCSVNEPEDDMPCDGDVQVAVTSAVPDVVDADLLVRGTATPTRNNAIRSLTVAGVRATPDAFNFSEWSATVPLANLLALTPDSEDDPDLVTISVDASPSCGATGAHDLQVRVNRKASIRVNELTLELLGDRAYLPADGSASGILQLTSNAEGRGAVVSLQSIGMSALQNGAADMAQVTLSGDGVSAAMASLLVKSSATGTTQAALVTASADGFTATPVLIEFAGAPRIFPPTAQLGPGQSLTLSKVRSFATQTVTCGETDGEGLTITPDPGDETFTLTAAEDLEAEATATLSCRDDYGQTVLTRYTAAP